MPAPATFTIRDRARPARCLTVKVVAESRPAQSREIIVPSISDEDHLCCADFVGDPTNLHLPELVAGAPGIHIQGAAAIFRVEVDTGRK